MRNERWLVGLVLADFFLAIMTIALEFVLNWTLPEPLRDHVFSRLSQGWSISGAVLTGLWLLMVVATLAAWGGLLLYWQHARELFVGAWIAALMLTAAYGPSVMTGAGAAIDTLEHLVSGALIGLVYFSDLSERYIRSGTGIPSKSIAPTIV